VDDDTVVQRSSAPLAAAVDGEIVMFHPDRGAYFGLVDVGTRIWELIEEPASLGAITTRLLAEYEVDPAACRSEAEAFLSQLADAGLVELR
jgi:PqqD family protein of HPr-rel-A system